MPDGPKQPSLTVLSGPLADTVFVLDEVVDNILIGSDPTCRFHIDAAGVSPIHARLWVDLAGITVYDTNSPLGLYVNDDRVVEKSPLRNGDVLWLGPPGDDQSVMLQCRVPASVPAAALVEPEDDPGGRTVAFMSPFRADSLPPPAATSAASVDEAMDEAPASPVEDPLEATVAESFPRAAELSAGASAATSDDQVLEEAGIIAEPDDLNFDVLPEPDLTKNFNPDLTHDLRTEVVQATVLDEPGEPEVVEPEPTMVLPPEHVEPTVAMLRHADPLKFDVDLPPDLAPSLRPHAFEEDIDETVGIADPSAMETVIERSRPSAGAPPPPRAPLATASPSTTPSPVPATSPVPPAGSAAPAAAAPIILAPRQAEAARPAHETKPATPTAVRPKAEPAARVRRAEPARPPARPSAPPSSAPASTPAAQPPGVPSSGGGKGAAIAVGALVLAGAATAGYFLMKRGDTPAATPPPTQEALASPVPVLTPPPVEGVTPLPTPEAMPPVEEEVTIVPGATPRPSASPSPRPTASTAPSPRTAAATAPPPTLAPAGQQTSPAARAASLIGLAQASAGGGNYDAAIVQYDEALKLEPQNASAQAGRSSAVAARAAARKTFVTGRTVVVAGKAKANLSGFDTSDVSVQKAPDFSGRLEFTMSPARPRPGDSYTLQIALTNDGKKAIKLSGMTVNTVVNGARSGGPMSPRVREVAPQQRAVLEELPGVWPPDATSWSADVQLTAGKDESLRSQVTWR